MKKRRLRHNLQDFTLYYDTEELKEQFKDLYEDDVKIHSRPKEELSKVINFLDSLDSISDYDILKKIELTKSGNVKQNKKHFLYMTNIVFDSLLDFGHNVFHRFGVSVDYRGDKEGVLNIDIKKYREKL